MTPDETKLGYLFLEYLRVSARDRVVNKFNVIGRSTKGEFEMWLRRDIPPDEKQTLIWVWDELKGARLINATGTDLINPDDWVIVSPRGLTISESEFAAMFGGQTEQHRGVERLIDAVTGILQRSELESDLDRVAAEEDRGSPLSFVIIDLDRFKNFNDTRQECNTT